MSPGARRWLWIGAQYALALGLLAAGVIVVGREGEGWLASLSEAGYVVRHPEMLWALAAIPALIMVRAHTLSDLPRLQQALSIGLKGAFVAALTLALIDLQKVETTAKKAAAVFVVDVSESLPDTALEAARAEVEKVWRASLAEPEATRPELRLVVFGNGAKEIPLPALPPGAGPAQAILPPLPRLPVPTDGAPATNVQAGLRLALTLFPEGQLPRVVIATDGLETEGNLAAEGETLRRFGVPVSYLDLGPIERPNELMVMKLELPEQIQPRVPFQVATAVRASRAMKAKCEVQVDGIVAQTGEHELVAGDNRLSHELTIPEGGDKKVAVSCQPVAAGDDRFATNNRYELPVKVPERPKVLYVEGEARYQKNLAAALQEDFDVEFRGARGTPTSLAEAEKYDLIFISDVPRKGDMSSEILSSGQMRVLEQYAKKGGGLIFAGGENSYGPGGWGDTILEREVLPVRLDVKQRQDTPNLALMLIIDRSGSMAGPKMDLAKEAAKETMSALQKNDLLSVVAFDSRPDLILPPTRAANGLKIAEAVERIRSGGGTNVFAALDFGYNELSKVQATLRHIILLTDGQSSPAGIIELAAQAALEHITISTVAVGVGADQGLLSKVAETANGRFYVTSSGQNIPQIFLQETNEVTRKALVEDLFVPRVDPRFRGLQMFRGLDMATAPALIGYVATRAKPRAEVIMTSHLGEPILARWRLGLGEVVAWTSDVKNHWAHYWLKWSGYAKFWRQLVRDTLRTETEDPSYQMVAEVSGNVLTVGVDAIDDNDRFIDGVTSEVMVTDPNGRDIPLPLTQVAAGRYEGKLPVSVFGPYIIRGKHTPSALAGTAAAAGAADKLTRPPGATSEQADRATAATYRSFATVAWPFPDEHLVGAPDLSQVEALAQATGGTKNPTAAQLFDVGDAKTESHVPLWPTPLPWALGFLVADVLLRRVRLFGKTELKWL